MDDALAPMHEHRSSHPGGPMPIAGLGLHIIVALICAIHAVRTRQATQWLFILFAFPLLGSVVYFFAIYLPSSRLERSALKVVSAAAKAIDPTREVREARAAFDDTPTARNQMRLAAALLEVGEAAEAAQQYEACLQGPFAADPDIRLGAARAGVDSQRHAEALRHLDSLRAELPEFRAEAVALLRARCLAATCRGSEARAEFAMTEARFGTYEAKAEYAIWSLAMGDVATSTRLIDELDKIASRWDPLTRELNQPAQRRLSAARTLAARAAA
jgi:hypothetical protein